MRFFKKENWKKEEREEIEYEPKTVRQILTEMKDISELILDLAYSALVLGDMEIADEVRFLEAHMDTLNHKIRLNTMLGSRNVENAEKLVGILQVAASAEKISNAAGDIVYILETIPEIKEYAVTMFQETDERISTLLVPENSEFAGRKINHFNIENETGVRIVAVRRGKQWFFGPDGDFCLERKDMLILRGVDEGFRRMTDFARGKSSEL